MAAGAIRLKPFALERYFARYEFSVRYVLCASDCQTRSVADLITLEPDLAGKLNNLRLGYVDSRGTPSLRQTIASLYESIDPEQVLVHAGAQEAILWFYFATLAAGDEVIVHTPCYASHRQVPEALGAVVVPWRAKLEASGELDVAELASLISSRTRAIVVNTPHNPSGYLMGRAAFEQLNRLAEQRGITVLSDEVFRGSEHEPADRLPAACDLAPSAVSLCVTSKTYGLAGLRVGWVATKNRAVYQAMASLKDYSTICNGAPNELLAEVALRHADRIASENVALIRRNLALLAAFFARYPEVFAWQMPRAGPVAFVKLLRGEVGAFCHELVEATGVLLLPGTVFDDSGNRFRIGFGRADFADGLQLFEAFVRERFALDGLGS